MFVDFVSGLVEYVFGFFLDLLTAPILEQLLAFITGLLGGTSA